MRDSKRERFCSRIPYAKRHSVMEKEPHSWRNRMDKKSTLLSASRRRGLSIVTEIVGP